VASRCAEGLGGLACCKQHLWPAAPWRGTGHVPGDRVCVGDGPEHTLSINPATRSPTAHIVANCKGYPDPANPGRLIFCDPAVVRERLIRDSAKPDCLAGYGLPKKAASGSGHGVLPIAPSALADARRWRAKRKLPADFNGSLKAMVEQGLAECPDDRIPEDPLDVLPAGLETEDYLAFRALGRRAGCSPGNLQSLYLDAWVPICTSRMQG
jgi:hypothetical protein